MMLSMWSTSMRFRLYIIHNTCHLHTWTHMSCFENLLGIKWMTSLALGGFIEIWNWQLWTLFIPLISPRGVSCTWFIVRTSYWICLCRSHWNWSCIYEYSSSQLDKLLFCGCFFDGVSFVHLFLFVLTSIAGMIFYTRCQSVGSFSYKFVLVSRQHICEFSLRGTIAIKKWLLAWSCPRGVRNLLYALK